MLKGAKVIVGAELVHVVTTKDTVSCDVECSLVAEKDTEALVGW